MKGNAVRVPEAKMVSPEELRKYGDKLKPVIEEIITFVAKSAGVQLSSDELKELVDNFSMIYLISIVLTTGRVLLSDDEIIGGVLEHFLKANIEACFIVMAAQSLESGGVPYVA